VTAGTPSMRISAVSQTYNREAGSMTKKRYVVNRVGDDLEEG
jgi:hypothetical protein